jgi:large subunit ribosomal protein L21
MYAVIKTGGKQHKVKPGDVIEVELIHSDGETISFTPLLVVDDEGGSHFGKEASKAVVTAKLVGEQKGDKVKILKYRPKTGYTRHAGHRQMYTLLEIQDVTLGGRAERAPKKAAPKAKAKAAEAPTAEAPAGESEPTAVAEESPVEATAPETGAADATGSEA